MLSPPGELVGTDGRAMPLQTLLSSNSPSRRSDPSVISCISLWNREDATPVKSFPNGPAATLYSTLNVTRVEGVPSPSSTGSNSHVLRLSTVPSLILTNLRGGVKVTILFFTRIGIPWKRPDELHNRALPALLLANHLRGGELRLQARNVPVVRYKVEHPLGGCRDQG